MVKIICLTLGSLGSNKQVGISGKEYMFHQSGPTVVDDREDAENFLKSNNGEAFKKVNKIGTFVEDVKEALAEVAKELPGKKKVKEEETLATKEQKEELRKLCGDDNQAYDDDFYVKLTESRAREEIENIKANILKSKEEPVEDKVPDRTPEEVKDGQKEATEAEKRIEEEEKSEEKKVYDYASLKALNKKDQVILLRELGGDNIKIPTFENGRINKILELQKKG